MGLVKFKVVLSSALLYSERVRKWLIFGLFFLVFCLFPKESFADCRDNPSQQCHQGQACVDTNGDGTFTCESQGPGQTPPTCGINSYSSTVNSGEQIYFQMSAGDNGETFSASNPTVSGACSGIIGFCGTGNLCANRVSQGMCTNVCSGSSGPNGQQWLHTKANNSGNIPRNCVINWSVKNGAGQTSCSLSISVKPKPVTPTKSPTVVSPSPTPPPFPTPPPTGSGSYYQAFGGVVTGIGQIADSSLPSGSNLIGNSNEPFKTEAGTLISGSNNVGIPASSRISESNQKLLGYDWGAQFPEYDDLLTAVLRNAGLAKATDLKCGPDGQTSSLNGLTKFFCYKGGFDSAINKAVTDCDTQANVRVVLPYVGSSGPGTGPKTIGDSIDVSDNSCAVSAVRPILVFVDGNGIGGLNVDSDIKAPSTNSKAVIVTITNGDLKVGGSVKNFDGVHLFSSNFSDSNSDKQLAGFGSLLGNETGLTDGFMRKYDGLSEKWSFDGRYLDLFKNVFSRPGFFWEELPPS